MRVHVSPSHLSHTPAISSTLNLTHTSLRVITSQAKGERVLGLGRSDEDMRKALVDKGQAPHAAIIGCAWPASL